MIVIIPENIQRDPKNRFWKHLNANNLDFENLWSDVDENYIPRYAYSLPAATEEDGIILRLKFPGCIVKQFTV